jgi:hypothetical protein
MAGALTNIDIDGTELVLDADGDTSITADTDDQIDIRIAGADDFQFTANTFTALSGSTIAAQALTATTIGATGVVTANAGIVVDNITIDGTEIDLSSGDLTLDSGGDIILDADGANIIFKDGGTSFGEVKTNSTPDHFIFTSLIQDKDYYFQGNDGGSIITALQLDMSDAGHATFNNGITLSDGDLTVASGHGINFAATSDASGQSSELLDDYEEGTWTPTLSGSNGGTKTAGAANIGRYNKVGNLVTATGTVAWDGSETLSGYIQVGGLPFASANISNYRSSAALGATSGIAQYGSYTNGIGSSLDHNQSYIWIVVRSTTSYSHTPTISDTGAIYGINISYRTS